MSGTANDWTRATRVQLKTACGIAEVTIARTFASRFIGLLGRAQLRPNEGLLFVPGGSIHTCWMRFAIDIVFLNAQFEALRIVSHVRPWRFVFAPRGTQFVLELSAGAAHPLGVTQHRALEVSPIANNS